MPSSQATPFLAFALSLVASSCAASPERAEVEAQSGKSDELLYLSLDTESDRAKALRFFQGACERDASWCERAAGLANLLQRPDLQAHFMARGCLGGQTKQCLWAGGWLLEHEEPEQAQRLLERGCDDGDGKTCAYLAGFIERGDLPGDARTVERRAGRGCELGVKEACTLAAYRAYQDDPPRLEEALKRMEEACRLGEAEGCAWAGAFLDVGTDGVPRNPARALELLQQACNANITDACTRHARVAIELGLTEAARSSYQRSCDAGDLSACVSFAYALRDGWLGERDVAGAFSLFQWACESEHHAPACDALGVLYSRGEGAPKDDVRAAQLYERACDGGDDGGCFNLANRLFEGRGVERDVARAIRLGEQTCESDAYACWVLGKGLLSMGEAYRPQALAALRRGCDGQGGLACEALAEALHAEHGLTKEVQSLYRRAVDLFGEWCDGRHGQSCMHLGILIATGRGAPEDLAKGTEFMERGCALNRQTCMCEDSSDCHPGAQCVEGRCDPPYRRGIFRTP